MRALSVLKRGLYFLLIIAVATPVYAAAASHDDWLAMFCVPALIFVCCAAQDALS